MWSSGYAALLYLSWRRFLYKMIPLFHKQLGWLYIKHDGLSTLHPMYIMHHSCPFIHHFWGGSFRYVTSSLKEEHVKIQRLSTAADNNHSCIHSIRPFKKHMLNTKYLNSVKIKIMMHWAMNYDSGMHRVLANPTV